MGTGFFRITTGRIAFDATTLLRKTRAIVSVPYSRIHVIATHDEAGLFPARLTRQQQAHVRHERWRLRGGLRGADKAHVAHNVILSHVV